MNENRPRSEDASGRTAQMRDTVRDTAASVAEGAKEQARAQYDRQKEVALGELDRLASALQRAGDELGANSGVSGRVINTIADRLQSFSRSLDGKDLGAVINDVDRLAHRNPAAFFGGAVAIGFLASRFLKSSGRGMQTGRGIYSDEAYGGYYSGGTDSAIGSAGYSGGSMGRNFDSPTSGSDFGRTGSGLGTSGSDFGTTGSGLGTSGSDFGTTGSSLGTTGSSLGTTGSSLGTSGSNLGTSGSGFGTTGSGTGSGSTGTTGSGLGASDTGSSGISGTGGIGSTGTTGIGSTGTSGIGSTGTVSDDDDIKTTGSRSTGAGGGGGKKPGQR